MIWACKKNKERSNKNWAKKKKEGINDAKCITRKEDGVHLYPKVSKCLKNFVVSKETQTLIQDVYARVFSNQNLLNLFPNHFIIFFPKFHYRNLGSSAGFHGLRTPQPDFKGSVHPSRISRAPYTHARGHTEWWPR